VPVEAKPLLRPDVLRSQLAGFELPAHVDSLRPKLNHWADLLALDKANTLKEQERAQTDPQRDQTSSTGGWALRSHVRGDTL
jgi:hypothetical protein